MEHIDWVYAGSKGVKCISSPEGNRNAVAEHALGMLLNLLNNISKADAEVKAGQWIREANRGTELEGKTIGIYGYGNTGSAFAKVLRGIDVKILAYDKYNTGFGNEFVTESSPGEIFSRADVLSLHLPLKEETKYLVNEHFFSQFKKRIYLINTSRGLIVRTSDLVNNLRSGKVLGACLDVVEYEETSFEAVSPQAGGQEPGVNPDWHYLTSHSRVILTPHIAGWTFESSEKMARILADKIIAFTAK
jgi:D-3-phosphoglycerate dehydrogenase